MDGNLQLFGVDSLDFDFAKVWLDTADSVRSDWIGHLDVFDAYIEVTDLREALKVLRRLLLMLGLDIEELLVLVFGRHIQSLVHMPRFESRRYSILVIFCGQVDLPRLAHIVLE